MVSRICESACGCSALPWRAVVGRLVDAMMGDFRRALWMVALLAISLPAFSRSGAEIPLPSLDGPIPNTPVSHTWNGAAWQKVPIDLSRHGYVEEEFYASGGAWVYDWVPDSDFDLVVLDPESGNWLPYARRAEITPTAYTTRIIVRRPEDMQQFSGRVVVEIINMTAGYDWTAIWSSLWEQVLKQGDVYVGITAKPNVLPAMVRFDAARYQRLSMPNPLPPERQACGTLPGESDHDPNRSKDAENGLVWDMLSQLGALLKSHSGDNPLGRPAERVYLAGESQSAHYMTRYFRWFHQRASLPNGAPVYDAYLAEAGGTSSAVMHGLNQCAQETNPLPRDDPQHGIPGRGVPLMVVHSEWDFPLSRGSPNDYPPPKRKPNANTEADKFMMWELAGASHGWTWQYNFSDAAREDVSAAGFETHDFVCAQNQPEINLYMVVKAAYVLLDRWVSTGISPPSAEYIQMDVPVNPQQPLRDEHGNAVGGLRMPEIAVPIARYKGVYAPDPDCRNAVMPFDRQTLESLYPAPGDYLDRYTAATQALLDGGFLLPEDARKLIEAAGQRRVP